MITLTIITTVLLFVGAFLFLGFVGFSVFWSLVHKAYNALAW